MYVGSAFKGSISFKNLTQLHTSGYLNVSDCNQSAISFAERSLFSEITSPHLTSSHLTFLSPFFFYHPSHLSSFLSLYFLNPCCFSPLLFVLESNFVCPSAATFTLKEARLPLQHPEAFTSTCPAVRECFLYASTPSHCLKKYANATAMPVAKSVTD